MMNSVKQWIAYLNDATLVAKFQNLCGIDIGCKDSGLNSMDEEEEEEEEKDQQQHGNQLSTAAAAEAEDSGNERDDSQSTDCASRIRKVKGSSEWKRNVKSNVANSVIDYSMCNHVQYKINNRLLYHLFSFGAMLGNEEFNCTFFPYWLWNVDGFVCRRVVIAWGFSMWFGQAIKDLVRSPRPVSPPVAKLEQRYELEYGFPSTHATIAIVIPFSLFFLTNNRYIYSTELAFIFCVLWSLLVCLSRIYLGMHSFLDVLCGALFGALFLYGIYPYLDAIDNWQLQYKYSPIIIPIAMLALSACYPPLRQWNSARGDSTMTLAVMTGLAVGSWLANQQGFYSRPLQPPPYVVKFPDMEFIGSTIMRMCLGGTVLIATRSAMKFCTYRCLCCLYSLPVANTLANQRQLKVELPYKFITYSAVAFNVVYTCPVLFRLIGIERIIDFTDLNPV